MIYKNHAAFICLIIAAPLLQGRVETNAPLLDSSNSSVVTLPAVTVVAQQESPDGPSTADPSGYSPLEAKGATRTLAPIMETPISEQVISQQVLKDQQTIYLNDALQNVSGVTPQGSSIPSDSFAIRGFDMQNLTFEDGFRNTKYNVGFQRSMANVQDIEVVKGPASVLYGQSEPGGLVNVVTKKPLDRFYFAIEDQIGSYNFYRTTVDMSAPINKEKTLLYRFNLDQENSGSFRNFINTDRTALFPTIEWKPTRDDHATVELGYLTGIQTYDNGSPFLTNGRTAPVSIRNNYAEPNANVGNIQDFWVKANATHSFSDDLVLHAGYRTESISNPMPNQQYYSGGVGSDVASGDLQRIYTGNSINQNWSQEILADLTARFKTWVVKHEALIGLDIFQQTYHYNSMYPAEYGYGPSINVYQPVYGQPFPVFDPSLTTNTFTSQTSYGAFFQDQMELPWHIHALAGFRYNSVTTANSYYGTNNSTVTDVPPLTPRFGLLWNPIKPVSLYASYTANYGATALGGKTQNGEPLPPQTAQQWEYGIKGEFLGGKLTTTASIYQLTKENIPTIDPSNPGFLTAVGQARSRGLELEAAGEILPGWRVIGGYSYINCTITQDNGGAFGPSMQGLRFPGVPYNSGSLWSTYEIQSGPLKRLKFGAGVVARSGEQAYVAQYPLAPTDADGNQTGPAPAAYYSTETIPAFAVVNLMASYPCQIGKTKLTAQVNINNLFDTTYYSTVIPGAAMPGAPINVLASLKLEF
jgi:iron complex outermembrane receptor protein